MKNITVVGSGTMGSGIAHCFAQYGYSVNLVDLSKDALALAMVKIEHNLDRQLKKEILTAEEKAATLGRITLFYRFKRSDKSSRFSCRSRF